MKNLFLLLLAACMCALMIGCEAKSGPATQAVASGNIVGEWIETSDPTRTRTFVLRADGTYEEQITFHATPDDKYEMAGTYELKDGSLFITTISGSRTIGGKREERPSNPAIVGGPIEWKSADEVVITVQGGKQMAWKRKA